jgi:hypothetical protein
MTAVASAPTPSLVVAPAVPFAELEHMLGDLGWIAQPNTMVSPAILPGEPELATWRHTSASARLTYTFNPVVHLRVLALSGPDAGMLRADLAQRLPLLGLTTIRELLRASDARQALLGVLAAGELGAFPVAEEVARLTSHKEPAVAAAAARVHERLAAQAAHAGIERLAREKKRHPERSALFPHLGTAAHRRQILRWLIHDRATLNDDTLGVLRSALDDPDWEVRATAVLAAARLGASPLAVAVRKVDLPKTSREGLDEDDRSLLRGFRDAAVALLSGTTLRPNDAPPDGREAMRDHLLRCVAGEVAPVDRISLFAWALTQPVPPPEPPPATLPPVIVADPHREGHYRLASLGIELVWIPPITHAVGDDDEVRMNRCDGFFSMTSPVARDASDDTEAAAPEDRFETCSLAEAVERCARLSVELGVSMRLPTADEWEMVTRGPDGRRYPWGNGYERDMLRQPSPWGARDTVGAVPQWTSSRSESGHAIICGGPRNLRCTARGVIPDVHRIGFRMVIA